MNSIRVGDVVTCKDPIDIDNGKYQIRTDMEFVVVAVTSQLPVNGRVSNSKIVTAQSPDTGLVVSLLEFALEVKERKGDAYDTKGWPDHLPKIPAVRIARKLFGMGITQAKEFVELTELFNPNSDSRAYPPVTDIIWIEDMANEGNEAAKRYLEEN